MLEKLKEKSESLMRQSTPTDENMLIGTWILFMQTSPEICNKVMDYLGEELYDYVLKEAKERGILK